MQRTGTVALTEEGTDSSPVVLMLRDARSAGARGVMGSEKAGEEDDWEILCRKVVSRVITPCHHTSRSRAARVEQHEDDWGRVRGKTSYCRELHETKTDDRSRGHVSPGYELSISQLNLRMLT